MAHEELLDALPAVARRAPAARHGRPRAARDVLARARPAGAAAGRDRCPRASCSPATGSTPVCRRRLRARSRRPPCRADRDLNRRLRRSNRLPDHERRSSSTTKSSRSRAGTGRGSSSCWCAICKTALAGLHVASVRSVMGRIEIELGPTRRGDEVRERLRARVRHRELLVRRPRPARLRRAGGGDPRRTSATSAPASFRVSATPRRQAAAVHVAAGRARGRRADQGGEGLAGRSRRPGADRSTSRCCPTDAFYFFGKEPGAGGLPTGTGGRVACLLSGGIDSPVAAYRMMRRGCSVLLIHFHSYPILSRASQEKVREIAGAADAGTSCGRG